MRSLSGSLAAAQKLSSRIPYLRVQVIDRFGGVRRLRPAAWYTGSEPAGPHGAACPSDGSLVRLRIAGATLYRQRVASPGSGSAYSSWTSWRASTRLCAIAVNGANLAVYAVDDAAPAEVYEATSGDNGASWSAFALAFTHAVAITAIAAAMRPNGDKVVIVNNGNNVSARRWNGASWGAAVTTTDGLVTPNGLACWFQGDFNVLVTGAIVSPGGSRLASRIFGAGFSQASDTWSAARTIAESSSGSGVEYSAPFLTRPDTWRASVRERFTGAGAYGRNATTYSPASQDYSANLWRELVPFNLDHDYGVAIAYTSATIFLTTPARVYAVDISAGAADLTGAVLSAKYGERLHEAETAVIELDNAAGTYNAHPALTKGAEVAISPGYKTAAGDEYSDGPTYWINRIEHDYTEEGRAIVRLHCLDPWAILSRSALPRTIQNVSGAVNINSQLARLFALGGFDYTSVGGSAGLANLYPATLIAAGEDLRSAIGRLLARVPDVIVFRSSVAIASEPLAAGASDASYTYQGAGHPVEAASYAEQLREVNHVRSVGGATANVIGESIDYTETELQYRSPRILADRELTSAALASDRAVAVARRQEVASRRDVLVTPVHAGVEVNDVIDITDARLSLSAAKRRVLAIETVYTRKGRAARYHQTLTLGNP